MCTPGIQNYIASYRLFLYSLTTDKCLTLLIIENAVSGFATTGITLSWLFMRLIHDQEAQERVRKEIDAVIGEDRPPSASDRKHMPFTEACIWETMRLHPLLPLGGFRQATVDTDVGEYRVPKVGKK